MSRLVVKAHKPWRHRLVISLIVVGLLYGLGRASYEYGRATAGFDFAELRAENARLQRISRDLKAENERLREEKAVLERTAQIKEEAYRRLNDTVGGLQSEVAELKRELAFYRGIVSPKEAARGLKVEGFEVSRNAIERSYRVKVVLTQVLKNDTVAKGTVRLGFEGSLNGEMTVLDLKQVSLGESEGLKYRFKYFQNLKGDVVLPEGFVPSRVIVTVDPNGKKGKQIEKVFDWPAEEI